MRRILSGVIENPHFGQTVLRDAITFSRLIFCFWGTPDVGMLAIRKDHGDPPSGAKRGDLFQIILIQVKGGYAVKPTAEDGTRLRIAARRHGACAVLLAARKKGKAARFFSLRRNARNGERDWTEVEDLNAIFR